MNSYLWIPVCEFEAYTYKFMSLIHTNSESISISISISVYIFLNSYTEFTHWARHWHAVFYTILLRRRFFAIGFRHWSVSGDLALTGFQPLTWISDFHCFGALGVRPGAWIIWVTVRAWRTGIGVVQVWASRKSDRKGLTIVFPWIVENTWNTMAHAEDFSNLQAPPAQTAASGPTLALILFSQAITWLGTFPMQE